MNRINLLVTFIAAHNLVTYYPCRYPSKGPKPSFTHPLSTAIPPSQQGTMPSDVTYMIDLLNFLNSMLLSLGMKDRYMYSLLYREQEPRSNHSHRQSLYLINWFTYLSIPPSPSLPCAINHCLHKTQHVPLDSPHCHSYPSRYNYSFRAS